jgi:hypothetical protein
MGLVTLRTLKRRKHAMREVPLPPEPIGLLDHNFQISDAARDPRNADHRLWPSSCATAWRIIKRLMRQCGIIRPPRVPDYATPSE